MHHRGDGALEALVGVGDHQLHPAQAAGPQAAQERRPEGPVLGVADRQAQHLAAAVGAHAGGDHHRLDSRRAGPRGPSGRWRRGTGREAAVAERAVAEGADVLVELGADPRDLGLRDAGVDAQRATRSSTLRVEHAVDVGLHHHRPQRPVDPPPRLEQRREERARPQLGDPQLQVAGLGGEQRARGGRCAGSSARGCARTAAGADRLGRPPARSGPAAPAAAPSGQGRDRRPRAVRRAARTGHPYRGPSGAPCATCEVNAEVHPVAPQWPTDSRKSHHSTGRQLPRLTGHDQNGSVEPFWRPSAFPGMTRRSGP